MPIDPLIISGIIGGAQTLGGLAQTMYGKSKAEGLKRPTFEIPKELQEKLTLQQIRAMQGMDDATKEEYLKNIDRMSFFTNRVASRAGVPQSLATTYQQKADAIGRLAAAEDEAKAKRMAEYYGGLQDMAEAKTKQFDINQMQPYLQQAKASQALIGAGLQNLYGGATSLGKTASTASLEDTLKETGKATTNELKDYLKAALAEAEKSKAATTTENPADKTAPIVDESEVTLSSPDETETTDITTTPNDMGKSGFADLNTGGDLTQSDIDLWKTYKSGETKTNPKFAELAKKIRKSPKFENIWTETKLTGDPSNGAAGLDDDEVLQKFLYGPAGSKSYDIDQTLSKFLK